MPKPAEPKPLTGEELAAAINEQVLPQLALLTPGPLAAGVGHAVQAALQHNQGATCTLMQARVMVNGRVCSITVQILAAP